jgi:hypothetical protein
MIRTTLQLNPGDVYLDRDKNEILIKSINWDRKEDVYLITLNGKHTYYANGILTHNLKPRADERVIADQTQYSGRAGSFNTSSLYRSGNSSRLF